MNRARASPLTWPKRGDARAVRVRDFPFAVIYKIGADELFVVAIAHDKRRPGSWRSRR